MSGPNPPSLWQSRVLPGVSLAPKAERALKHPPPPLLPLPAANLQSPYAQVPCIPLCPRLDKKTVRRKQGGHYVPEQCPSTSLGPDVHSILLHTGSQGGRWVPRGHGGPRRRPIRRCVRRLGPNPRGIQPSRRRMQTLLFQGQEGKGQKREETSLWEPVGWADCSRVRVLLPFGAQDSLAPPALLMHRV